MQVNKKSSDYIDSHFTHDYHKDKIIPFRSKKAFNEINNFINLEKNARILDVGLGTGDFLNFFYKKGYKNLFGADFNNYVKFDILKKFEINDIEKDTPYEKDEFELVICTEVIEHTFNPIIVMDNLISKTKKGGGNFL